MNPFRAAADWAYKKPNLVVAGLFGLLPTIFYAAARVLYGFPATYAEYGYLAFRAVVVLFLSASILYVLLYIFKGRAVRGKFSSLITGLSFVSLIRLAFIVVGFASIALLLPAVLPSLSIAAPMHLPAGDIPDYVAAIPIQGGALALGGVAVVVIGTTVAALGAAIITIYELIARAAKSTLTADLVVLVLMLASMIILEAIIP